MLRLYVCLAICMNRTTYKLDRGYFLALNRVLLKCFECVESVFKIFFSFVLYASPILVMSYPERGSNALD
jgi:hypothetical protein